MLQEGGAENSLNMMTALFRKAKALLQNSCLQRKTTSVTNLHRKAAKAHPEFTGSSNEGPEQSSKGLPILLPIIQTAKGPLVPLAKWLLYCRGLQVGCPQEKANRQWLSSTYLG